MALIAEAPPRYRGERKHAEQDKLHGYSKEGYDQKSKKDLMESYSISDEISTYRPQASPVAAASI